jgi:hypothetical protein
MVEVRQKKSFFVIGRKCFLSSVALGLICLDFVCEVFLNELNAL